MGRFDKKRQRVNSHSLEDDKEQVFLSLKMRLDILTDILEVYGADPQLQGQILQMKAEIKQDFLKLLSGGVDIMDLYKRFGSIIFKSKVLSAEDAIQKLTKGKEQQLVDLVNEDRILFERIQKQNNDRPPPRNPPPPPRNPPRSLLAFPEENLSSIDISQPRTPQNLGRPRRNLQEADSQYSREEKIELENWILQLLAGQAKEEPVQQEPVQEPVEEQKQGEPAQEEPVEEQKQERLIEDTEKKEEPEPQRQDDDEEEKTQLSQGSAKGQQQTEEGRESNKEAVKNIQVWLKNEIGVQDALQSLVEGLILHQEYERLRSKKQRSQEEQDELQRLAQKTRFDFASDYVRRAVQDVGATLGPDESMRKALSGLDKSTKKEVRSKIIEFLQSGIRQQEIDRQKVLAEIQGFDKKKQVSEEDYRLTLLYARQLRDESLADQLKGIWSSAIRTKTEKSSGVKKVLTDYLSSTV